MKAETCAVRDILPGDIADLARLHAEAFPFEPWDRDSLARLIAMPAMRARVIENAGRAKLGFLLALVAGGEAEIVTLCVAPDARRRGVARDLLADLESLARAAQSSRLVLEVAADNHAALRFYESRGFTPIGRREGYYRRGDAAPADAVMLARNL
jgi:[ribosomal protein S18]-alanine N-acetyltransferase